MEPLVAPIKERIPDHVEPVGLAQVPKEPIATPALQETLDHIPSVY